MYQLTKLLGVAVAVASLSAFTNPLESGVKVGESVSAFEPFHVTGPDKDTNTCPVCKYGATPAAQIWVNGDNLENVGKLAKNLEARISQAGVKRFRTFFVFLDPSMKGQLPKLAEKYGLHNVALTYVKGADDEATKTYGINTSANVKNTVMVYANREVVANMINLKGDEKGLLALNHAVDKALQSR